MDAIIKSPKKKVLKKWVRTIIVLIISTMMITAIFLIISSIDNFRSNDTPPIYTYHLNQDVDYRVYLNDNSFIPLPYLEENQVYLADLVNNIEFDILIDFTGTRVTSLNYTYEGTALLSGSYRSQDEINNSIIWTKEYPVVNNVNKASVLTDNFEIRDTIIIDYGKYNSAAASFRDTFKIPLETSLRLVLTITISGSIDGENITETDEILITIPLNQPVFRITTSYVEFDTRDIIVPNIHDINNQSRRILYGSLLLLCSLALLGLNYRRLFNIPAPNYYLKTISKILKDYGNIIVEIKHPVDFPNMRIIEVKDFGEMLDLSGEFRIPILFYESPADEKSEFMLINNNIMYYYFIEGENHLK